MNFLNYSTIFVGIFSIVSSNTIRRDGVVTLPLSFVQTSYVTEIGIGTPGQRFVVEVSTANPGSWISSAYCGPDLDDPDMCEKENGYNSSASATFVEDGKEITVGIEDGNIPVQGYFAKDLIQLPGEDEQTMISVGQITFGQMVNVPRPFFYQTNVTGSLGLGFTLDPSISLIEAMKKSSLINSKVAGFNFKRVQLKDSPSDTYQKDTGSIMIGSPNGDQSVIEGNPIWVKGQKVDFGSIGMGLLHVPVMGFDVNSKPFHCTGPDGCLASISANSLLIRLPEAEAFRLNNVLGFIPWMGVSFFTDCKRMDYLPNIDITIGSLKVSIPASDYLIKTKPPSPILYNNIIGRDSESGDSESRDSESGDFKGKNYDEDEDKVCMSRFIGHEDPDKIVLGQPFLQNVYTLFDYDQEKFGFAKYKAGVN